MNRVTLDLSHAAHLHGLLCAEMLLRPAASKISACMKVIDRPRENRMVVSVDGFPLFSRVIASSHSYHDCLSTIQL
jgi:hypothetical protein